MNNAFAKKLNLNQINFFSLFRGLGGFILLLFLSSWGFKGHQTIGYIAQRHLTPKAASAVKQLLGSQSLEDVATWADQVTKQPEWRHTASWHYVNVPAGLSQQQFIAAVKSQSKGNLLQGLAKCELELSNPEVSREQKIIDLKFIVHLAGDAHQPMHVSRTEDRGGNKIQIRFNGRGTNLHALWDSKLFDKQHLSNVQFATKYDVQSPATIAKWQSNGPLEWMYESYLLSTRLYAETNNNRNLTNVYYNQHITLADKRLEIAGIRLAGLLNRLFKNGLQMSGVSLQKANNPTSARFNKPLNASDITDHYNETVSVTTKIFGHKNIRGMTLVDAGGKYPNQLFTIVLKGNAQALSKGIVNKTVQVTGTVINYRGKPEIIITDPANLVIR